MHFCYFAQLSVQLASDLFAQGYLGLDRGKTDQIGRQKLFTSNYYYRL